MYQLDTEFTEQDGARVKAGFASYAAAQGVAPRGKPIYWSYRDGEGACIANIEMFTAAKQGFIRILWVDEAHRGQGLALKLMNCAEDHAFAQGMTEMWVDTHAYQAPDFYLKCGYQKIAEVPGYLDGHARIFFKKLLV